MIFSFVMFWLNHLNFIMSLQGWIQHDLLGRGVLCQLWCRVVSDMRAINLLYYCKVLLDYSICIVIVVYSSLIIILLKLLYLILSLVIFCFIMKNSTPPAIPLARARGVPSPPPGIPAVNPFLCPC